MSTEYNKAVVALIMALLVVAELHFGVTLGVTEDFVISLLALLSPILVWLVPNRAGTR